MRGELSNEMPKTQRDWRDLAACLDEEPELFFPIGNTGPSLKQIEEAKKVCLRCEVIDTCLEWAITNDHGEFGVWGGMSEDERRAIKRRRARARSVGKFAVSGDNNEY